MKATALEVTDTTALVELRPCWIARWFGARTVHVALRMDKNREWGLASTEIRLVDGYGRAQVPHGLRIRTALDYRPVVSLPKAVVM